MAKLILVLGGARSGKSQFAEDIILKSGLKPVYLATAEIIDEEMATRIIRHRARRGPEWHNLHAPLELAEKLLEETDENSAILVDCMTLWLSNLLYYNAKVEKTFDRFIESLKKMQGLVVFVANEVGLGLVPESELGRRFRDLAGLLNQEMAKEMDEVYFIAAGLPLKLKG